VFHMHFWIDKRSQGCGFSGRHLVPPSLSGKGRDIYFSLKIAGGRVLQRLSSGYGRNQRFLCGGFHPKPMVTPVHRFQSIESVANNGVRYARSPGYHSRAPIHCQPSVHYKYETRRQITISCKFLISVAPPAAFATTIWAGLWK
jgi:hypothetical protein